MKQEILNEYMKGKMTCNDMIDKLKEVVSDADKKLLETTKGCTKINNICIYCHNGK